MAITPAHETTIRIARTRFKWSFRTIPLPSPTRPSGKKCRYSAMLAPEPAYMICTAPAACQRGPMLLGAAPRLCLPPGEDLIGELEEIDPEGTGKGPEILSAWHRAALPIPHRVHPHANAACQLGPPPSPRAPAAFNRVESCLFHGSP